MILSAWPKGKAQSQKMRAVSTQAEHWDLAALSCFGEAACNTTAVHGGMGRMAKSRMAKSRRCTLMGHVAALSWARQPRRCTLMPWAASSTLSAPGCVLFLPSRHAPVCWPCSSYSGTAQTLLPPEPRKNAAEAGGGGDRER